MLGAFALACQVFAGHLQDALFTAVLVGMYTLFRLATERTARGRLSVLGAAVGVVALGVALSAVQWVPSKELLDRSPRAGGLSWGDLTYRVVEPRTPADAGRPRGVRDARPRYRLDGRLLPLPRDERLPRPDRAGPGRRSAPPRIATAGSRSGSCSRGSARC